MTQSSSGHEVKAVNVSCGSGVESEGTGEAVQNVDLNQFSIFYQTQKFIWQSSALAAKYGVSDSSTIRKRIRLLMETFTAIPEEYWWEEKPKRNYGELTVYLLDSLNGRPSSQSESQWQAAMLEEYPNLCVSPRNNDVESSPESCPDEACVASSGDDCVAIAHVTAVEIEPHDYSQSSQALSSISQRYSASPSHLNGGALKIVQTMKSLDQAIQNEQKRIATEAEKLQARKKVLFDAQDALPGMAKAVGGLREKAASNAEMAGKIAAAEVVLGKQLEEIRNGPERELPS